MREAAGASCRPLHAGAGAVAGPGASEAASRQIWRGRAPVAEGSLMRTGDSECPSMIDLRKPLRSVMCYLDG